MSVDVAAAEEFIHANARLIDRHRSAVLLHDAPKEPVLRALRAYRNADGGFGHALEPDVRDPYSQPASTLHALDVLSEIDALDDPMVSDAATWVSSIAHPNGSLPFVLPTAADAPLAPFLAPSDDDSFLTFGVAGALWQAGAGDPWLRPATEWCWARLEHADALGAHWVLFALRFLDSVSDEERASAAFERLRPLIGPDGAIAVAGGTENERITPLMLSQHPGARSRVLFRDDQVEADLDALEEDQQSDGGWTFDWLAWSPGQTVECRGLMTVRALHALLAHGRVARP